jgi:hypothetical protein
MSDVGGGLFSAAGFSVPGAAPPAQSPDAGTLFKSAGFVLPSDKPAPKPSGQYPDWGPVSVPGTATADNPKNIDHGAADTLENKIASMKGSYDDAFVPSFDPLKVIPGAASSWWDATKKAALSSGEQYRTGLGQVRNNQPATGVANIGLGTLGFALSPLSGATDAFIKQPVTQLTGNPGIGEDIGNLGTLLLPTKGGAAAVKTVNESRAINTLVKAVGPENVPAALSRMQNNPRLSLMDVSDPVRTMAQGLIDPAQPQAQNILTQAVRGRAATLPAASNSAFTEAMGPTPNVPQMLAGLKQRMNDVGTNLIQPALENAKPVNVSPVLSAIDADLKPGIAAQAKSNLPLSPYQEELTRLRQQLTDDTTGETLTNAARLHSIQSTLRAQAQNLLTSASGADRNLGGQLMGMRNKLVDAIDAASPPVAGASDVAGRSYKTGLKAYRDANQIDEAFDAGFDTLKNRSGRAGLEDRPDMFEQSLKQSTPEELVARRLGTRLDVDQKIRGVKNQSLAAQNITSIEYNREKLAALFGEGEADRLVRTMNDASDEARTNAKMLEGSKTAETLAGREALKVPQVGGGNVLNYVGGPAAEMAGEYLLGPAGVGVGGALFGGAKALQYGTQFAARKMALSRNVEFAKAASATGPARTKIIEALANHPDVVKAIGSRARGGVPQLSNSSGALTALPP